MKKRLLSLALCGALLCGALAGCGGNETPSTSQESSPSQTAEEPKILTTAVSAELNTLYPLNMDVQNNIGTKLCYEGLVNYENGEIVPCLAESWEFSDDGKALTFHLKEGVTFHDGTPFNAEAVKTDFEFAHPNPNFSNISAAAKLESIEVVDEYTVTFRYPNAYFAYLMDFCYPETMVLVSPAVLEEGNYQSMNGVVGTGPYVYEEIVDGDYVRFVRNENYWGEQPYYDEVIVKYIPDASARLQALQSGEIDLIYGSALLTWDDYQQATSLPNIAEKANALLDEAGWVLNESTGIREKDGQALSLKYTYDSGDALNKSLATAVKSQLAAVGINVETEGQEMMTWWQEGVAGNYDLIMWNTEQPYTSPHNYFIPMLSRSPHVPSLPAVEGSDEFLALIEEFQTTDDSARVQEIFDELLNFDNDNVLDLPLLFVKDMIVYNTDKIAGYDFSSTPMFFDVRLIQPAE